MRENNNNLIQEEINKALENEQVTRFAYQLAVQKTQKLLLGNIEQNLKEIKTEKEDRGWIQTYTGIKFYPFSPAIADIHIEDIAWSLCHINRFLGHLRQPWSVGQHSIFGAIIILKLTGDKQLGKWFLLHDSAEAYLGDLIRPFKILPQFAFYKEAENNLYSMILQKFGLYDDYPAEWDQPSIIKDVDRFMLYLEIENLHEPIHSDNAYMPGSDEHLELKEKLQWNENLQKEFDRLLEVNSKTAYQMFLYCFHQYSK